MPLIKCKECGKDISDRAPMCPFCGITKQPLIIEQTGKKWKRVILISSLILIVGILILFSGAGNNNDSLVGFGVFLGFIGFLGLIVGRFGRWWHHK